MEKHFERIWGLIFSAIFAGCIVVGNVVYRKNDIGVIFSSKSNIAITLCLFLLSFVLSYFLFKFSILYIPEGIHRMFGSPEKRWKIWESKLIFPGMWFFFCLCYVPAFLAMFPGAPTYDYGVQIAQTIPDGFSGYNLFHPPLHTMFLEMTYHIAVALGCYAFTVSAFVQIILLSGVFAFFVWWMIRSGASNFTIVVAILFFSINPAIQTFIQIPVKDALLAGTMVLLVIEYEKMDSDEQRYFSNPVNWIRYVAISLLCCLLRNNVIYAMLLCIPFILARYRKRFLKVSLLVLLPITLTLLINNILFIRIIGMGPGESKEALSVPIEQLANTFAFEGADISEEDIEFWERYFDANSIVEAYNPRFADPAKQLFSEAEYKADKKTFWKNWAYLGKKNPLQYINAFLTLNIPYWYPGAGSYDVISDAHYIVISRDDTYAGESKMPQLRSFYLELSDGRNLEKIPLVSWLFALPMALWIVVFSLFTLLSKKQGHCCISILPCLMLLITYLAGPVSNFRYIFPIYVLYPFFLFLFIDKDQREIAN